MWEQGGHNSCLAAGSKSSPRQDGRRKQRGVVFFFSFLFYLSKKTPLFQHELMRTHRRSCKKRRQVWNAEKQTNQKKTAKRLNHEPQNNVTLRKVGAGKATGRACRLKREPNGACEQQQGLPTKMPLSMSVCVCVCVRNSRDTGGGKENKQENKYIRELEGFQETAGSEGFNTWYEHQPGFEKREIKADKY